IPNAKKRKEGRVECPAKQIWFNSNVVVVEDFPAPALPLQEKDEETGKTVIQLSPKLLFQNLPADLKKLVASPAYDGEDRSQTVASVIYNLRRRRYTDEQIASLISAYPKGIGERYVGNPKKLIDDIRRIERKYVNGQLAPPANKSSIIMKASDL